MGTGPSRQLLEEELNDSSLTCSPASSRVLPLSFDPRSPSATYNRTPIQVTKTPEPVVDPRSPTYGISRTPIFGAKPSTTTAVIHDPIQKQLDMASSNADDESRRFGQGDSEQDTTVESLTSVQSPDALLPTNELCESDTHVDVLNRSCSEPDLSLISQEDDVHTLLRSRTAFTSRSFRDATALLRRVRKRSTSTPPTQKDSTSLNSKTRSPLKIFSPKNDDKSKQSPLRSPLKVINGTEVQRSPLALRNSNTDSPRVIVQQKQIKKIQKLQVKGQAVMMSGGVFSKGGSGSSVAKYTVFSDDKENM